MAASLAAEAVTLTFDTPYGNYSAIPQDEGDIPGVLDVSRQTRTGFGDAAQYEP